MFYLKLISLSHKRQHAGKASSSPLMLIWANQHFFHLGESNYFYHPHANCAGYGYRPPDTKWLNCNLSRSFFFFFPLSQLSKIQKSGNNEQGRTGGGGPLITDQACCCCFVRKVHLSWNVVAAFHFAPRTSYLLQTKRVAVRQHCALPKKKEKERKKSSRGRQ